LTSLRGLGGFCARGSRVFLGHFDQFGRILFGENTTLYEAIDQVDRYIL